MNHLRPLHPELSCVVPFHNEADLASVAIDKIMEALLESASSVELIAVDDGSSDETWARIVTASRNDSSIRGIRLSRNFGKEAAISAGLKASRGSVVVVMDGDLQHPPQYVPKMVDLWRKGYQLVSATKKNRPDQGSVRRALARLFNRSFTRWTGVALQDATDFRLMDRDVVDAFLSLPEVNLFFRGATSWLGFSSTTIQVEIEPRPGDDASRWTLRGLVRMGLSALLSFTSAPLHVVTLIGVIYLGLGTVLGIQTIFRWMTGTAVTGFTTVILLILGTGGLILMGLGVLGEYTARVFDEVKRRPRYIVRDSTEAQDSGGS